MDIKNAKIRGIHFPENPIYLKDEGVPLGRRLYALALYPFKCLIAGLAALIAPWLIAFLGSTLVSLGLMVSRTGTFPLDKVSIDALMAMSLNYTTWVGALLTVLGFAWLMLRR